MTPRQKRIKQLRMRHYRKMTDEELNKIIAKTWNRSFWTEEEIDLAAVKADRIMLALWGDKMNTQTA